MLRFAYRLAAHLGRVNVRQMLGEISWTEFIEWMVFNEVEPFDPIRADMRAASVCATVANVNRDRKKRSRPFKSEDFVLHWGDGIPQKPRQTWQQQKMIGKMVAAMYNSEPRKRGKPAVVAPVPNRRRKPDGRS
jgi:hypothetical protein